MTTFVDSISTERNHRSSRPGTPGASRQRPYEASDLWTHVVLAVAALLVVVAPRRSTRGHSVNTLVYEVAVGVIVVLAGVAYLRAIARGEVARSSSRQPSSVALRQWFLQRGVLAALVLAPIVALLIGLLGIANPAVGYGYLVGAAIALPPWVRWRRRTSTDPAEPVHHLGRVMLWASVPFAVFTIARIPTFYLYHFVYWMPWYLFGGAPLGLHDTSRTALASGAVLYSLQGIALTLGFYVLFKRHSFFNMFLYFVVFVSSLYSFVFPVLLMVGSHPKLPFHLINYWAHFWMGIAAWAAPRFWGRTWPRLRGARRVPVLAVLALVWTAPYSFAFAKAGTWQAQRQQRIEAAAFEKATLQLQGVSAGEQPAVTLRVGPRTFVNYAKAQRSIEIDVVSLDVRLVQDGTTVASCPRQTRLLPSVSSERDPARYAVALAATNYTVITLRCDRTASIDDGAPVEVRWDAQVDFRGERVHRTSARAGAATTTFD